MTKLEERVISCPHCGESCYQIDFGCSTLVYYMPIYKDGVNINTQKNKIAYYCTCMNCGMKFSFTEGEKNND